MQLQSYPLLFTVMSVLTVGWFLTSIWWASNSTFSTSLGSALITVGSPYLSVGWLYTAFPLSPSAAAVRQRLQWQTAHPAEEDHREDGHFWDWREALRHHQGSGKIKLRLHRHWEVVINRSQDAWKFTEQLLTHSNQNLSLNPGL